MADLLSTATTPLILIAPSPSRDTVAAAYALAHAFAARDKAPSLVCADDITAVLPATLVAPPTPVTSTIRGLQDFIIQFDTAHNAIDDVRVTRTESAVTVTVTPERTFIDPRDFSFAPSQMHYDAIVLFGAASLAESGLMTEENAPLLEALPLQAFAPADVPVSVALCEALTAAGAAPSGIVAQSILTGIVSATDGLRTDRTTAPLLRCCATLMRNGADLQTIMLALYKTTTFGTLRLWGGLLKRLTLTPSKRIVTAILPPLYGDDEHLLTQLLTRTTQFLAHFDAVGVFWSHGGDATTHGLISARAPLSAALGALFEAHHTTANGFLRVRTAHTAHDAITRMDQCANDAAH